MLNKIESKKKYEEKIRNSAKIKLRIKDKKIIEP
jgi:hypothetical protein